jgi:hypothetical protein
VVPRRRERIGGLLSPDAPERHLDDDGVPAGPDSGDGDPAWFNPEAQSNNVIIVWGWAPSGGFHGEGAGASGGGYDTSRPEDEYRDGAPQTLSIYGRDCPVENAAAQAAMEHLYANSSTARSLMERAVAYGVTLNLIKANLAGYTSRLSYDPASNTISWDPYVFVVGKNADGSDYVLTPIMLLAHEFVHAGNDNDPAYQYNASEPVVMQIANQIAAEMNASTGSSFNTNRDVHARLNQYHTDSPTSSIISIVRPGCE